MDYGVLGKDITHWVSLSPQLLDVTCCFYSFEDCKPKHIGELKSAKEKVIAKQDETRRVFWTCDEYAACAKTPD